MRKAHTIKCPFLSRITGLAPSSLPVMFSRMVVFPAFRRPMINTRNRSHTRRMSSDETSMLVRSTKQRNQGDDGSPMEVVHPEDVYKIESEVQLQMISANFIILAKYIGMSSLSSLRQGTAKCAASLITYRHEVRHPNAFLFGYWVDVLLCCRFFERSHDNPSWTRLKIYRVNPNFPPRHRKRVHDHYTVVLTRISCALCLTLLLCTPFMKIFFDGVLPDDSQP